ncbi:MAG: hypothetical protein BMS9Abin37_3158 [Acidobacteriota bacterium]|nr:MAG: hypothetical protein BMS9Abin37_3158 [Acidobacteriota bacterium]
MSARWFWIVLVSVVVACSDSTENTDTESDSRALTTPELQASSFVMSARILGPVQNDDDADLRIELIETNGVAAHLNSLVLRCTNGVERHWGAGNIAADRGSNRIEGNSKLVIVRHYLCPSSGRPARLEAVLVDVNGFQHHVVAAPFHPDWPGV